MTNQRAAGVSMPKGGVSHALRVSPAERVDFARRQRLIAQLPIVWWARFL